MPKLKRSNEHLPFPDIKRLYEERKESLTCFCVWGNTYFTGVSKKELKRHLAYHLREVEYDACLTLLAAIEAALRLDFDSRHTKRLKDSKSKEVRRIAGLQRGDFSYKIPIDKLIDLLAFDGSVKNSTIDSLKIYFKFRHWLAHGRYWLLKIGRAKPTFADIYQLAQTINNLLYR